MNRTEYRKVRALIRANGAYALRWLTSEQAVTFAAQPDDPLQHRAWVVSIWGPASPMLLAELRKQPDIWW